MESVGIAKVIIMFRFLSDVLTQSGRDRFARRLSSTLASARPQTMFIVADYNPPSTIIKPRIKSWLDQLLVPNWTLCGEYHYHSSVQEEARLVEAWTSLWGPVVRCQYCESLLTKQSEPNALYLKTNCKTKGELHVWIYNT